MIYLRRSLASLLLCLSLFSAAQSPSPEVLVHNLKGKTLLLRGKYIEDNLAFDAQGKVTTPATPGPFSISAIKIEKVHLTGATLEIQGHRDILINIGTSDPPQPRDIQFIPSTVAIHIVIARDSAHPEGLSALVAKVFAVSIDDALAGKTDGQRRAELFTLAFLHDSTQPPATAGPSTGTNANGTTPSAGPTTSDSSTISPEDEGPAPQLKAGMGVTAPSIIYSINPEFTDEARRKKISGSCIVALIVDRNGFPIHIHIVRSLDPGLDKNAIAAVSQYRFAPAMRQGRPVAVGINLAVTYRIY